jgi:hypothetical protein
MGRGVWCGCAALVVVTSKAIAGISAGAAHNAEVRRHDPHVTPSV